MPTKAEREYTKRLKRLIYEVYCLLEDGKPEEAKRLIASSAVSAWASKGKQNDKKD
jgi:hypothetical protein